ncbi:MAG TPA: aspartate carbamoyltransferase catalytic subunit, partial [Thermaerobacter sp.]
MPAGTTPQSVGPAAGLPQRPGVLTPVAKTVGVTEAGGAVDRPFHLRGRSTSPGPSAPAQSRFARRPRSLTGIATLSTPDLADVLSRARRMLAALERSGGRPLAPAPLAGRRIVTLFYENSTRTAQSFHVAAHLLGAAAFDLPVARSSVQKGESLRDTLRTCEALGFDAVILRHPVTGAAAYAAAVLGVPVINAGDGTGEHPTQALLDALTILRHKGRLAGLKVAIVGDVRHSRVARSNALLLARLGAEVWLCGPPGLLPAAPPCPGVTITPCLDEALDAADVVMALRIQRERLAGVLPDLGEYRRGWGIGPRQLERARPDAILMHPGPVNRGIELDPAVMDDPRCVVEDQVRCGVAARMAVLEWALRPVRPEGAKDEPAGGEDGPAGDEDEPSGSGAAERLVADERAAEAPWAAAGQRAESHRAEAGGVAVAPPECAAGARRPVVANGR